jgi:hypothetical protein
VLKDDRNFSADNACKIFFDRINPPQFNKPNSMKKLLLLSIFVCFIQTLQAQKIDLDKRDVTIEQVLLPQKNALTRFNTYNVELTFNPSTKDILGFSDAYLKNQLNLDGYKYVVDKGDFSLKIRVDNIALFSEEIIENIKEAKNSAGQMVKTITYIGQLKYAVNSSIRIIDNASQSIIEEFDFANFNTPIVITTKAEALSSEAQKTNAYNKKNLVGVNEQYQALFSGNMNKIKSKYGYRIVNERERFWEIDVVKAPELAVFNQHLNNVLNVLTELKAGGDLGKARTELASDLAYWTENGAKVVVTDKNMKKLKYAYYLNLSKAQYYLELFDACESNARMVVLNDYDVYDGNQMLARSNSVKEMLKTADAKTWHLSRLNDDAKTYYNLAANYSELVLAEKNANTDATPQGYFEFPGDLITINDTRRSGKLISKKDIYQNQVFLKLYGATFIYTENGIVKKMEINPDSISSMDFGPGLNFSVYKFDNNQDFPVKRLIFKEIGKNRKIQLLKYFETNVDIGTDLRITKNLIAMEIVLRERESGKMAAVGGWGNSSLRERTAKFYDQFCPKMKDLILNNAWGNKDTIEEWHSYIAAYYVDNCN